MAWQILPGLKGKIYIPDPSGAKKKHPCPDCSACQQCSQERCRVCRNPTVVNNSGGFATHNTNKPAKP